MDSGRHAGERERGEGPKYAAGLDYELGRPWESGGVAIKGADSQDRVSHTALHHTQLLHMSHFCYFHMIFWLELKLQYQPLAP